MLSQLRKKSKAKLEDVISSLFSQKDVQDLKGLRENNPVHKNEDVFIHTKAVTKRLDGLLSLSFIKTTETKKAAVQYFKSQVGKFSKAELLVISGVLHDIGKAKFIKRGKRLVRVLKKKGNGTTEAIGHEAISARYSDKILKSLEFSRKERRYITGVIKIHNGFLLSNFEGWYRLPLKTVISELKGKCPIYLIEVLLFMLADNKDAPSFLEAQDYILNKLLQCKEIYNQKKVFNPNKSKALDLYRETCRIANETSKPWPAEIRLFHLVEEVGELCDIYLQYKGWKDRRQFKKDLAIALADVLFDVFVLYDKLGIDFVETYKKELKKLAKGENGKT